MLQLDQNTVLATDHYYVLHKENGLDELHITLSPDDPAYPLLREETRILETGEQQYYIVKTVSAQVDQVELSCALDLRDWQARCYLSYSNQGAGLGATVRSVLPPGWTLEDQTSVSGGRLVEMDGPTPLEIALEAAARFGCALRFFSKAQKVTMLQPDSIPCQNTCCSDELNLRQVPLLRADSTRRITRLYVMGKKGLTIQSINGGKPYVDASAATGPVVCGFWKDTRYDDAYALRSDAQRRVDALAAPERIWRLKAVELGQLWPERAEGEIGLFSVVRLIDRKRQEQTVVQVVEEKRYPHHPEMNQLTVSTKRLRTLQERGLPKALENANSAFYQQLNNR